MMTTNIIMMTTNIISMLFLICIQSGYIFCTCNKEKNNVCQVIEISPDSCDKKYYPNGVLESITCYKNGQVDGWSISYYQNGKPKAEVFFVRGKKNGEAKYYNESGEIKMLIHYSNEGEREFLKKVLDGGKENLIEFYRDGKLYMTVFQKNQNNKIVLSDTVYHVIPSIVHEDYIENAPVYRSDTDK